jgi:hypothetical protein
MLEEILARFVGMAWLGWVLAALIIIGWFVYWNHFRKGTRVESGLAGPYQIDGFADCHYPENLGEWKTELLKLVDIRNDVFRYCEFAYANESRWIVPKVTLIFGKPRKDHPNVMWSRSGDRIVLRIQPDMYWHFAGEVHNVFRFGIWGPGSDKLTYSNADKAAAVKVRDWIAKTYGG